MGHRSKLSTGSCAAPWLQFPARCTPSSSLPTPRLAARCFLAVLVDAGVKSINRYAAKRFYTHLRGVWKRVKALDGADRRATVTFSLHFIYIPTYHSQSQYIVHLQKLDSFELGYLALLLLLPLWYQIQNWILSYRHFIAFTTFTRFSCLFSRLHVSVLQDHIYLFL